VALILVVVVAVVAVVYVGVTRFGRTTVTATFPTAVGVAAGTDVRILGVTVGSVDEVTPMGDTVEVKLHVDRGVDIPADAKAVQVTPSVIPDRTVQLLPAYSGGPTMESGAHIPIERTATPVEVDKLYESVTDLTEALGPEGANADGALDRFVSSSADNLAGNGAALDRRTLGGGHHPGGLQPGHQRDGGQPPVVRDHAQGERRAGAPVQHPDGGLQRDRREPAGEPPGRPVRAQLRARRRGPADPGQP